MTNRNVKFWSYCELTKVTPHLGLYVQAMGRLQVREIIGEDCAWHDIATSLHIHIAIAISIVYCKTVVNPVRQQWSYCSFALKPSICLIQTWNEFWIIMLCSGRNLFLVWFLNLIGLLSIQYHKWSSPINDMAICYWLFGNSVTLIVD